MMNDLRHAFRQFLRAPGFSAIALLTIALGIGACTAIFSVVSGVLLRPLPYPESDRLVVVRETNFPKFPEFSVAAGQYFSWLEQSSSWESLTAVRRASYNLTGRSEPQRLQGRREDEVPGHERVAILSHGLWQRQFGDRPDVLGQTMQLDGQPFTIVGVMPASFGWVGKGVVPQSAARADLYTTADERGQHGEHYIGVFGRLKTGVTVDQARTEMTVIADRLAKQFPDTSKGWGVKLTPMLESDVGEVRPVLLALLGAVGFLLLIACANVANLLLVLVPAKRP
jgi:putative ABC transport system permease protein